MRLVVGLGGSVGTVEQLQHRVLDWINADLAALTDRRDWHAVEQRVIEHLSRRLQQVQPVVQMFAVLFGASRLEVGPGSGDRFRALESRLAAYAAVVPLTEVDWSDAGSLPTHAGVVLQQLGASGHRGRDPVVDALLRRLVASLKKAQAATQLDAELADLLGPIRATDLPSWLAERSAPWFGHAWYAGSERDRLILGMSALVLGDRSWWSAMPRHAVSAEHLLALLVIELDAAAAGAAGPAARLLSWMPESGAAAEEYLLAWLDLVREVAADPLLAVDGANPAVSDVVGMLVVRRLNAPEHGLVMMEAATAELRDINGGMDRLIDEVGKWFLAGLERDGLMSRVASPRPPDGLVEFLAAHPVADRRTEEMWPVFAAAAQRSPYLVELGRVGRQVVARAPRGWVDVGFDLVAVQVPGEFGEQPALTFAAPAGVLQVDGRQLGDREISEHASEPALWNMLVTIAVRTANDFGVAWGTSGAATAELIAGIWSASPGAVRTAGDLLIHRVRDPHLVARLSGRDQVQIDAVDLVVRRLEADRYLYLGTHPVPLGAPDVVLPETTPQSGAVRITHRGPAEGGLEPHIGTGSGFVVGPGSRPGRLRALTNLHVANIDTARMTVNGGRVVAWVSLTQAAYEAHPVLAAMAADFAARAGKSSVDLALVEYEAPEGAEATASAVVLRTTPVAVGETLIVSGSPNKHDLTSAAPVLETGLGWFTTSHMFGPGASGSGAVDANDALVGLLWGGGREGRELGANFFIPASLIAHFLEQAGLRLDAVLAPRAVTRLRHARAVQQIKNAVAGLLSAG